MSGACFFGVALIYFIVSLFADLTPLGGMIEEGMAPKVGEGGEVDGAVAMAMYGSMD